MFDEVIVSMSLMNRVISLDEAAGNIVMCYYMHNLQLPIIIRACII